MVYFLHKLTFSSSETFLKSITKLRFLARSIDNFTGNWRDAVSVPIMQLVNVHFVCSYMTLHLKSKMEDQDRGFRRGRGGRRRERGFRDRSSRVRTVTLNCVLHILLVVCICIAVNYLLSAILNIWPSNILENKICKMLNLSL